MKDYDTSLVVAAWDQPQGLLDLIGMSFRLWRRNFGFIVRVLIWPSIILMIGNTGLQCCFTYIQSFAHDIPKGILLFVASLVFLIVGAIRLGVVLLALLRITNGFAIDWPAAMAYAWKRISWLVGLCTLTSLMSILVMGVWFFLFGISIAIAQTGPAGQVAAICAMLISGLGFTVTIILLSLYWCLLMPILACEDTTFFGVLGRSFQMLVRHFLRVLGFGCVIYMVMIAAAVPVSLPVALASAGDIAYRQITTGSYGDGSPSLFVVIFAQFWETLTQMVLRPVTTFAFGLLYLDLRHRADGLDLRRRLRQLKEQLSASS